MDPNHSGCSGQGDDAADLVEPMAKPSAAAGDGSLSTTEADESTLTQSDACSVSPLSAAPAVPSLWETFAQLQREADAFCEWIEVEADLSARLCDKPHAAALLRSVYRLGVEQAPVLRALACLAGGGGGTKDARRGDEEASLRVVAAYFCLDGVTDTVRLACLRLLVVLNSPLDAGWQVAEPALWDALEFVMQSGEWEFLRHSELTYLDELRAMVRFLREQRVPPVGAGNDVTQNITGNDEDHLDFLLRMQWTSSVQRRLTPDRKMCDGSKPSARLSRDNLRQLELQLKSQLQESLNMSRSCEFDGIHDSNYVLDDGTHAEQNTDGILQMKSPVNEMAKTTLGMLTASQLPSDFSSKDGTPGADNARIDHFAAHAETVNLDASVDAPSVAVREVTRQQIQEPSIQHERFAAVTTLMAKYVPSVPILGIFHQSAPIDGPPCASIEHGDVWDTTLSKTVGQR